jgi:hypothetical protein
LSEHVHPDLETLLTLALAPVDPPAHMADRLEATFTEIAHLAAEELDSWELAAMRDPRNWVRPAVALAAGTTAGAALVVLGLRGRSTRRRRQETGMRAAIERAATEVADETRKALDALRVPGRH